MKKLTGIDDRILNLDGDPIPEDKMPKLRYLIQVILNRQVAKNAEESLDVNQILLKLRQTEPDIELENGEFRILSEKIKENQAKLFQGSYGQLTAYLEKCDKASEKKSDLEVK